MDIKSKKGASLVEVIAAIAIMAIIMVPISLVFTTAYSSFIGQSDKVAAQQSAREVLYGKGMSSYGVMGDLERSNVPSGEITIGGTSVLIPFTEVVGGVEVTGFKKYSFDGSVLYYEETGKSVVDYFDSETSSNGSEVRVTDFQAQKVNKVKDPVTGIDKETETDLIQITVTVICGKSGKITLQSSYRIPNIEK